jgi:methylated-DNA-[protein]-cysteine S-methyltransferase
MKQISDISMATSIGKIKILWTRKEGVLQIIRILLPDNVHESVSPDRMFRHDAGVGHDDIGVFCLTIEEYLKGSAAEILPPGVDLSICSRFQKKVLLETCNIPRGKVMSYGHLSQSIGIPRGARAVGTALGKNPFPLIIPCHRVVRESGHLGGFGGGLKLKKTLLEMEGVRCDSTGKVLPQFYRH